MTEAERFWAKVEKTDGCWLWTASKNGTGYGQFRPSSGLRSVGAHRWAYTQLVGPIPDDLTLDHTCRVRACVRPDHLEPVTQRENVLRGNHPHVITRRTGRCVRGHSMADAYVRPDGSPTCRTCKKDRARLYTARKKAAAAQP